MRKLEKRDKYNLLIIIASFFVFFIIIFINSRGVYASHIDFSSQHYMIPDYFRKLFYETGNLFPSYAFNLGDGQNIYNFSYYGFLNPIILLSYLFPHLKMLYYLNIILVVIVIISVILFYKFITAYTNNKNTRLILGMLFLLSIPLIFHTHRHPMFIGYMPFLLMALFGVEHYVNDNKKILLIISTFLIIMTSYFFAVPSLIVILIYAVYLWIKQNNSISFKELLKKAFILGLLLIIPVLMSMVLILPSFYAILNSRFEKKGLEIIKMFIPDFSFNNVLYSQYALGLTSIFIFSVAHSIINKSKENKFLGITFLIITFIPFIGYLLNGFMYINGKVFIPFLPLAFILITYFINNLEQKKIDTKKLVIISLIISILGCINFDFNRVLENTLIFYIIDFLLIVLIVILVLKKSFKWTYLLLVFPIILCSIVNLGDNLEAKYIIDNQYSDKIKHELANNLNRESKVYRTVDDSKYFQNANNIRVINEYKNTMYSSLTNKNYKMFNWYLFEKENPYRNDAIYSDNSNILYNIYTASKYYISENNNPLGYTKIGDSIYKNDNVFSIGYVNHKYMSEEQFNSLEYPYNIEALMNYTIIKENINSNYETNLKEIPLTKTNYNLTNKNQISYKYKLKNEYQNKILIIRFNMDYTEKCSIGDTFIKINNSINKLTCSGWKYHNKNYTFEYVISDQNLKDLDITLSKGTFKISNLKAYTLDYDNIKEINNSHDNLILSKEKTKGDIIEGDINTSGGILSLSIPYDNGYKIYVDKKEVKSEIVNKHLLGFHIKSGNHKIKIIYKAPLLNYGKMLSLLGMTLLIIVIFIDKRRSKYEKNNNAGAML